MAETEKRYREAKLPLALPVKPKSVTAEPPPQPAPPAQKDEIGGPTGPEPTRYGDWERNGRCTDF